MEDTARDDAAYLKSLRLSAGLDLAELAALSNLSAGQIRQLEDGGESLFYSPQIKTQSLRRVIQLLESPQPSGKPTKVHPQVSAPRTSANVIEDIIRLSEKNLKGNVVSSPVRRPLNKAWLFTSLMLVFAFGAAYVFWMSNRDIPQSVFNEWVEPLTHRVSTATTVVQPNTATNATQVTPPPEAATAASTPLEALNTTVAPVSEQSASADIPAAKNATPISTAMASSTADCTSIQGEPVSLKSAFATKAGNYVYFQTSKAVQICIEDKLQNKTLLSLEPGATRSVHGNPPWTVASHDLKSVDIYYQGAKVWVPSESVKRIFLKEQPLSP
jgi:transcriptional regulator with XRE-family HTH domain